MQKECFFAKNAKQNIFLQKEYFFSQKNISLRKIYIFAKKCKEIHSFAKNTYFCKTTLFCEKNRFGQKPKKCKDLGELGKFGKRGEIWGKVGGKWEN